MTEQTTKTNQADLDSELGANYGRNLDWLLQKISTFDKTSIIGFQGWVANATLKRKQFVVGCINEIYLSLEQSGCNITKVQFMTDTGEPMITLTCSVGDWTPSMLPETTYSRQVDQLDGLPVYYFGDGSQTMQVEVFPDFTCFTLSSDED